MCAGCGAAKPRTEYYPKNTDLPPAGKCRSCRIASATEANRTNPNRKTILDRYNSSAKGRAGQERFDESNPGKRKDYVDRHYLKFPERLAAKRERDRLEQAARYHADPETAKRLARESLKRNPETKTAIDHRRRAAKLQADGSHTAADLRAIWAKQSGRCATCGIECHRGKMDGRKWTIDHIVPLSRGGSEWPSNLRGLCLSCNATKKDRM